MEKIESKPQTNPQNSRLSNFKGKTHKFSREDSVKGGKASSDRKSLSNSFNAMKTGRYSKRIPHCHTCAIKKQCGLYDPNDPKAPCKILDIPGYRELVLALRLQEEDEIVTVINKHVQKLYLKDLTTNDRDSIKDFILLLLKIKDCKYKRGQENTINIQVNNFHNEFNLFKDSTIKVLRKYPKIMKEWRDTIESAKQSD